MSTVYHVYCDESCHLEHDRQSAMVLGAVWCPKEKTREANVRLREIKQKHGLSAKFEIKWTKVSPAKFAFYQDVMDYFFDDDHLHFRAVVAKKAGLSHEEYEQSHDDWYYKMYFTMLKNILSPEDQYRVFLDMKDTRGKEKVRRLHQVLCNSRYDFSQSIITDMQEVRSDEINLLQLADLLIGTISYFSRGKQGGNRGKDFLVERMRNRSGLKLTQNTLMRAQKVNLLVWEPQE